MRWRRESGLALGLALVAALLLGTSLAGAEGAGPKQRADALRHQQRGLSARSHSALLSLYALDSRLTQARGELARLHTLADALRLEQRRTREEAAIVAGNLRVSRRLLGRHLRTLYEQGEPDTIAVLLGATSLEDAVSRLDELELSAQQGADAATDAMDGHAQLRRLADELAARVLEVQALEARAERTAAVLASARAERVAYVASLARQRRLNARQIAALDSQARRVVEHAQAVQARIPGTAPATALTVADGARALTVTATGYSLSGRTATGLPVGPGIVAVDPSIIPLGTRMTIPGYGEGVAADRGSAVQGFAIDLWFPRRWRTPWPGAGARLRSRSTRLSAPPRPGGTPSMSEPVTADEQALDDVRVLIVDDHDLFRGGLRNLLEEQGVQVVGEAAQGQEALRIVREVAPDVVVMDLNMPGMSGVEATRHISTIAPLTRVVMLTISDQDNDVIDAILAGACGYLLKDSSIHQLIAGIRAASLGESLISPTIASKVLQRVRASTRQPQIETTIRAELSEREIDVLKLIANGKDNAMIAGELHISPKTVKNHISNILMKLQIDNRIQAAVYAVRSGIV